MNKKLIARLLVLSLISAPFFVYAGGLGNMGPFGGQVTATQPCNNGLLLTVKEPFGVVRLMWNYGELPYLTYTPPHPGQYLVGMDSIQEVCTLGTITEGSGNEIAFHGESI